jgi:hypothetical protein
MQLAKTERRPLLRKELVPILIIKISILVLIKIVFFNGDTATPQAVEQSVYGIHTINAEESKNHE